MLGEQNASTAAPGQEPTSLDDNRLTYTLADVNDGRKLTP